MSDTTTIKGLEQDRASFAYQRVHDVLKKFPPKQGEKEASKDAKAYKSYSKKLPMMIKTNGLGSAMAFALSKGKSKEDNPWGILYIDINKWLRQDHKIFLLGENPPNDLAEAIIRLPSIKYRALTVEVLAFLNWLRQFSDGLIEGEDENTDE